MIQATAEERTAALARIDAMRAAGIRIEHTVYNGFVVAFRKPDRAQTQWWKLAKADPQSATTADENLAKAILVEPTLQRLEELVDEYPMALESIDISKALARALGIAQTEEKKAPNTLPNSNGSIPSTSPSA
jgi:hypothetical protein